MDFTFSEDQLALVQIARQIMEDASPPERLRELEDGANRFDPSLWAELAKADVLGIALPTSVGGSGLGFLELCTVMTEVGWNVAAVPAYATLVLGAETLNAFGTKKQQADHLGGVAKGEKILTAALKEPGRSQPTAVSTTAKRDGSAWRLDGSKELVPAAQLAQVILIPATAEEGDVEVFLVDTAAPGCSVFPVETTNGEPYADLTLDSVTVTSDSRVGEAGQGAAIVESMYEKALVGLAAVQLGVVERALQIAATYTTEREQFGRPIATFQAVQQRMADAFIDAEAIRWTMWYAAWKIASGRPALHDASIAKFWASEAGARIVATAQQVHGGVGIDTTYPLFRYYLFAKQNELSLGAGPQHLAGLARGYAEGEG